MTGNSKIESNWKRKRILQVLIYFQLIIAALAVAITLIVGVKIKPLIELKTNLEKQIRIKSDSILIIEEDIFRQRQQLRASREAVAYLKTGIDNYHMGKYETAIVSYDYALKLDSLNAYILDLKGYSLFKLKRFDEAAAILARAVRIQPDYAWGYFDLARIYCAMGSMDLATNAIKAALELQPELAETMRKDGEFTHLCKPLLMLLDEWP